MVDDVYDGLPNGTILALGVGVGLALGGSIGVALNDFAIGIAIGVGVGLALGMHFDPYFVED